MIRNSELTILEEAVRILAYACFLLPAAAVLDKTKKVEECQGDEDNLCYQTCHTAIFALTQSTARAATCMPSVQVLAKPVMSSTADTMEEVLF